jgi:hypothetical protein
MRIDKGCLLSELDWAPTQLRADLHAIEHRPVAVLRHCGQPPSHLPAGWNLQLPARRGTRIGGPQPRVGDRCCVSPLVCRSQRQLELNLVPAHDRLAFGQPERQINAA